MEFAERQWKLFDFVKEQHENRKRMYNHEPYLNHLMRVAEIVSQYSTTGIQIEIALCHDLLENTLCSKQDLALKLIDLGYDLFPRNKILKGVYDLTDHYTKIAYPMFSRKKRKELEANRICDIMPFSQTIKYAEIIDNTQSLMEYDPDFAKVYLNEISAFISEINEGNEALYLKCRKVVKDALDKLQKLPIRI